MNDRVRGHGFHYTCRIGVHEAERLLDQRIRIDFDAETDWRVAARADRARNLVDYGEIHRAIGVLVTGREWRLVEAVAESVAELICTQFPVIGVTVEVTKHPLDMRDIEGVSVVCFRQPADFES